MATRKIETEIVLGGEKEFNRAMTSVNNNLKNLKSDMAAVTAEFDDNAGSVDALTAKQKILDETVAQQDAKVDALRQRYEKLAAAENGNTAAADKAMQAMNDAIVAQQKAAKAAQQNADALEAAKKASNTYTPVTQKAATAVKEFGGKVKDTVSGVKEAAHHVPVLGEALDVAGVAGKAAKTGLHAAGTAVKAVGTASAAAAKGVATASAAMAKGFATVATGAAKGLAVATAAAAALGTAALTTMVSFAKESAEAAQAASDAGEQLSASQEKWLAYSQSLSGLEASAASAKGALAGVLLPVLSDLSAQGAQFLNDFTADMEAAGTDTKAQTQVITDYIVKGASMIKDALPEYIAAAKDILGGLAEGLGEAGPELIDMGLDIVMELVDGIASASPAMAEGAIDLLNKLVAGLGKRAPELTKAALGMVKALLGGLTQNGSTMMDGAKKLVTALIQGLGDEGPEILDMGMDLVVDLLDGIIEAAPQLAETAVELINHLIQGLTEKGPDLITSAAGMVADLVSGLAQAAPQMIPAATQLVTQLLTTLIESAPQLLSAGVELVLGIIEGIFNSLGDIGNAVDSIVSTFVEAMANSDNEFLQVGANMIKGIWNGISNATEWLFNLLSGWVDDVIGWIQAKFEVNSPSKLTARKVGAPMAEGIGYGFKNEMKIVNAQIADSIDTSFDVPRPGSNRRARTVAATTAGGKVVNLTIYTQKLSDADVAMLLDYVNQKFGEAL